MSLFRRRRWPLLQISLCRQTGKRTKRTDGYLSTKPTPRPRTLEKSTWQRREASKLCSGRESLVEQQIHQDKAKSKDRGQVLWSFPNLTSSWKTSLQTGSSYKIENPQRFHISLLKQDTTRKGRMNQLFPEPEPEFNAGNNKKYEVEAIIDSAVNAKEAEGHLPSLYYLVSWKGYLEEKSTWEPSSTVIHLRKMISTFYKDYPEKPTATSSPFDSTPPMAKLSVKPVKHSAKQKQSRPIGSTKRVKE